ncbi:replication initiator [Pseudonocardia asaccharolytica]|uniref:Uncharacterized protein n=1 Tax=Pseudonocardia asaccharolytica DSM 44247 = NBRC 16224 TaxID=1123024 RepID=A0A511DA96_9PSEU|nr:hypothetical protein PA7_44110 [Pseudonocardia asaccharolytica DSM 44247 = NBRC 16224]
MQEQGHRPEHLGIAGRRVLVSRKWSNKSLDDHKAERAVFVRQLLERTGVRPAFAVDDGPFIREPTRPGDPDRPPPLTLLLQAISQRSDGAPTTTPRSSSQATATHPTTTVRQLAITTRYRRGGDEPMKVSDRLWSVEDVSKVPRRPGPDALPVAKKGYGPNGKRVGRYLRYEEETVRQRWAQLDEDAT